MTERKETHRSPSKPLVMVLAGPTGIGKSAMALALAEGCGGEIISADSMQVYRRMDIGTAKPTSMDRARVPHHLVDVVDPDESFHVARFVEMADAVIANLWRRHRPIFVVGGTGLYIRALLGGLIESPPADSALREYWKEEVRRHGKARLYEYLRRKDPKAAATLAPNDTNRILRALEVWEGMGLSIVDLQAHHRFSEPRYRAVRIGLTVERQELFERIERRVETMMADGFLAEVRSLLDAGYHEGLKSMQSLGYRHLAAHLQGKCTLEEAVRSLKRDSRHYAKRQLTWFGAEPDILWFFPEQRDAVGQHLLRSGLGRLISR